jgi:RimJ/RimL family protein N-acetyltransferase
VPDEPAIIIEDERVALGPLRSELAPMYMKWVNDPAVRRGLATLALYSLKAEEDWVARASEASAKFRPEVAEFTIYDRSDMEPVGSVGLLHIDWAFGNAELGILLGERRGQGLGTEATRLALDWGFVALGLHNVMLTVLEWNAGAIRCYEKAGFREIGRRRGAVVSFGRRYDEVLMDAVADEWRSPVLEALAPS